MCVTNHNFKISYRLHFSVFSLQYVIYFSDFVCVVFIKASFLTKSQNMTYAKELMMETREKLMLLLEFHIVTFCVVL